MDDAGGVVAGGAQAVEDLEVAAGVGGGDDRSLGGGEVGELAGEELG